MPNFTDGNTRYFYLLVIAGILIKDMIHISISWSLLFKKTETVNSSFHTKKKTQSASFFYLRSLCSNGWLLSSDKQNLLVMEGKVQAMGKKTQQKPVRNGMNILAQRLNSVLPYAWK